MALPPLLTLQDIALTFGGTPLLEKADLSVGVGERLAVVGRNGSGKSTLLKIAAGMVEQDAGTRFVKPGATMRYLPQEPSFEGYKTVMDYVAEGLTQGDDAYRAEYLIGSLGLRVDQPLEGMSGGEARRVALARTLAPEPDILLLDEPTNHLDLPAIEWLEDELSRTRSALVMISHDRRFLQNLSKSTLWVTLGETRLLGEGFGAFEDWRDKQIEEEEEAQHKLGRQIAREEHWVRHGVSGRRKRNMRRMGELQTLKKNRVEAKSQVGNVNFTVTEGKTSGKIVVEAKHVFKTLGEQALIKDFSCIIERGERVAIIGPNGAGKSTLLNLLTGALPADSGEIKRGSNLEILVVDQKRASLKPEWTLKDALTDGAGDMVSVAGAQKHVMSYMKDFLFLPEQAGTPISRLSGGERGRLMLARGLRLPSNVLVLDEPTNDLDLETLDLLQELITDYEGTVLLVSHDRDFIDRLATSTIASEGDGHWQIYPGGYQDMARQRGRGVEAKRVKAVRGDKPEKAPTTAPAPSTSGKKLSFKQKHALETLPLEIADLERKLQKAQTELAVADLYTQNPDRFNKLIKAQELLSEQKLKLEERWLELEMLREEMEG